MKKYILVVMFVAVGLLAASPAFAHCGTCGTGAAHADAKMKQCKIGCQKPCCAKKADKVCSLHGKKNCCDKKGRGTAKTNIAPRTKK